MLRPWMRPTHCSGNQSPSSGVQGSSCTSCWQFVVLHTALLCYLCRSSCTQSLTMPPLLSQLGVAQKEGKSDGVWINAQYWECQKLAPNSHFFLWMGSTATPAGETGSLLSLAASIRLQNFSSLPIKEPPPFSFAASFHVLHRQMPTSTYT